MQERSSRIVEFDALRGMAAMLVVVHHGLCAFYPSFWISGPPFRHTPLSLLDTGRPIVVFFFVLSGVVLTKALIASQATLTVLGFVRYTAQRAVRLCLPALVATMLSIALYRLTFHGSQVWPNDWLQAGWSESPTVEMLSRHALLFGLGGELDFDPALWSLEHELRLSILLPLLAAIPLLRLPSGWTALATLGFLVPTLLTILLHAPLDQAILGSTQLLNALIGIYFSGAFAIGAAYAFADAGSRIAATPIRKIAAAITIMVLSCTTYDPIYVVISLLILWLAQQLGSFQRALRNPVLQVTGKYSFSLYLAHMPVLFAVTQTVHFDLLAASLYVLLTVPATAFLFHAAEKPAHRLARVVGRLGPVRL